MMNCVTEIPRHSLAKMEVIKEMKYHPIMQDTRNNKYTNEKELRYYAQFMNASYGFLPQTWEQNILEDENGLKVASILLRAIMTPWILSTSAPTSSPPATSMLGGCLGRSASSTRGRSTGRSSS